MLKLSLLKTFVSVAESTSFTRAAGEMYRSQSAISMQIKRLEDILHVSLFNRSGKAVSLSKEGEVFLQYCYRIIQLTNEAVSAVRLEGSATRIVRVGCIEDYAGRVIPRIIADFLTQHPQVQIEVKTGDTAQLVSSLGQDHDLIIIASPVGAGEGAPIRQERLVWARAKHVVLEDQLPLAIALQSGAGLDRRWATVALDASGRTWRCAYHPSGIGTLQGAVEEGLAIGVFKRLTLPSGLEILGIDQCFPDLPPIDISIQVAKGAEIRSDVKDLVTAITHGIRTFEAADGVP